MTPVTHVYGSRAPGHRAGRSGSWHRASSRPTGPAGYADGSDIAPNVSSNWAPQRLPDAAAGGRGTQSAALSCITQPGYRQFITYQPASRYWPFQCIELGIFVALAAALIAVTFAVINRRDA